MGFFAGELIHIIDTEETLNWESLQAHLERSDVLGTTQTSIAFIQQLKENEDKEGSVIDGLIPALPIVEEMLTFIARNISSEEGRTRSEARITAGYITDRVMVKPMLLAMQASSTLTNVSNGEGIAYNANLFYQRTFRGLTGEIVNINVGEPRLDFFKQALRRNR